MTCAPAIAYVFFKYFFTVLNLILCGIISNSFDEYAVFELTLYDYSVGLGAHALSVEHVVLEAPLLDGAVGVRHFALPVEFVVLELAFFYGSVDEDLTAVAVQLVTLKYTLLESFLVNVAAKAIKTVLAIIISNHLAGKRPLLLFLVINYPDASNIYLLRVVGSVFYCDEFLNISDSELIFEFKCSTIIQIFKLMPTVFKVFEKEVVAFFSFEVLLVGSV